MLAVVMTSVQSLGGADLRNAPPVADRMTIKVASLLTGLAQQTIRNDLSEFKARFDPPAYMPSPGKRWGRRLITARDLETLRRMYPIRATHWSPSSKN